MQQNIQPITVSLSGLLPILRELGLAAPRAVVPLKSGAAPVYRADLRDGTSVVVKTYDPLLHQEPGKEIYASGLLAELDVPVTRFHLFDDTCARLPFRYSIANYLPGEAVFALQSEPDVEDLYRQMGALLRRLHTVRMEGYGRLGSQGLVDPLPTNEAFITAYGHRRLSASSTTAGSRRLPVSLTVSFSAASIWSVAAKAPSSPTMICSPTMSLLRATGQDASASPASSTSATPALPILSSILRRPFSVARTTLLAHRRLYGTGTAPLLILIQRLRSGSTCSSTAW